MFAEEWGHLILETVRHSAGMRACVNFKRIGDAVPIEHVVQLGRIWEQVVLVSNVDRDLVVSAKLGMY